MASTRRTVTVSLPPALIRDIDRLARSEGRTRSELFREAVRQYVRRVERWNQIFAFGEELAKQQRLTEEDVIKAVRQRRRRSRTRTAP